MCLSRIDLPSGEAQFARDACADDPLQRGEQWGSAELDLGMGEDGVRRCDAHVAEQAEVESAAERGTVDRGDHRFRKLPHGEVVATRAVADGAGEFWFRELL